MRARVPSSPLVGHRIVAKQLPNRFLRAEARGRIHLARAVPRNHIQLATKDASDPTAGDPGHICYTGHYVGTVIVGPCSVSGFRRATTETIATRQIQPVPDFAHAVRVEPIEGGGLRAPRIGSHVVRLGMEVTSTIAG